MSNSLITAINDNKPEIEAAIQAAPDSGGKLSIKTQMVPHFCLIEFKDTGSGIDPQSMDRIFEPYFSTKKEGSGLGLVFVKETIENHGGKIQVESSLRKGTTLTLSIPLKQPLLKLPRPSRWISPQIF